MNTDSKKYPIRFYGRTWMFWAGVWFLGPMTVTLCGGYLPFIVQGGDPKGRIVLTIFCLTLISFVIVSIFQVFARQLPILKIYREGIMIRSIGTPLASNGPLMLRIVCVLGPLGILFALPLVNLWRCITLQAFQIRTVYLRWESIEVMSGSGIRITGWIDKDADADFGQDAPLEPYEVSYEADSFGISIDKVSETLLFFLSNPGARDALPSWHDEETVFGNDAFDFQ